jgi:hypothetical protein
MLTAAIPGAKQGFQRRALPISLADHLPILHEDRLVGKLDAVADRKASTLRVHAIHEDVPFTRAMTWLGLGGVQLGAAAGP